MGRKKHACKTKDQVLFWGLDLDPVHGVGHHSVGMRVRIPAVVSDLRAMPDTPKCSVDGCLNGTNPDFDGFVCWGRRMDRLL